MCSRRQPSSIFRSATGGRIIGSDLFGRGSNTNTVSVCAYIAARTWGKETRGGKFLSRNYIMLVAIAFISVRFATVPWFVHVVGFREMARRITSR